MSVQLHVPAALPARKEPPVPIGEQVGWTPPELVWTTWKWENSWPYRDSTSDPSVVQSVASRYTVYSSSSISSSSSSSNSILLVVVGSSSSSSSSNSCWCPTWECVEFYLLLTRRSLMREVDTLFTDQTRLAGKALVFNSRVLSSNLGRETGRPEWGFSLFSSVPPGKCRYNASSRARSFLSTSIPVHQSLYHSPQCDSIVKKYNSVCQFPKFLFFCWLNLVNCCWSSPAVLFLV
jgi:hypothetical protein